VSGTRIYVYDTDGRVQRELDQNGTGWNLYTYVLNNPLSAVDPNGLECVWDDGSFDSAGDAKTGTYGGCTSVGGTYHEPSTFTAGNGQDWSASANDYLAGQVAEAQALRDSLPSGPDMGTAMGASTSTSGTTTTINLWGANWQSTQVGTGVPAFRNNNPGNVEAGSFASGNGGIGADGRFAVFPTSGTGTNALDSLLHGPTYENLTIDQVVARYAPAFENNTAGYQQFLHSVVGINGNTALSSLSPAQFSVLESGIARYRGTVFTRTPILERQTRTPQRGIHS
jgi:hypothetical protein